MGSTILYLALGVCIGMLIDEIISSFKKTSGVLKIDHSNPEKDVYKFCIDDLDILDKKKSITIKIDHNADLSRQ